MTRIKDRGLVIAPFSYPHYQSIFNHFCIVIEPTYVETPESYTNRRSIPRYANDSMF